MRGLVIGGTGNIGKLLCDEFNFDSISSTTGYNVPHDLNKILDLSVDYDIIINCIPDENQNIILTEIYNEHTKKNLNTYLISLGSMSYRINDNNHPKNQLLEFSESILLKKSTVKHTLVNLTWCFNNKDNDIMFVISEEEILSIFKFLIKFSDNKSIVSMIEVKGKNVL